MICSPPVLALATRVTQVGEAVTLLPTNMLAQRAAPNELMWSPEEPRGKMFTLGAKSCRTKTPFMLVLKTRA